METVPLRSLEDIKSFVKRHHGISLDEYWQDHRFDKGQTVGARIESVEKSEAKIISAYYEFVCKMRGISIEPFFAEHPGEYDRWRRLYDNT